MNYRLITIEGNIGAGKTTLATLLAKRLDAKLVLEAFSDNPFLPKFYADPDRYGFPLELFFMAERYKQLSEMLRPDLFQQTTVSDYLFIKCLLFAKVNLPQQEYQLYKRLFDIIHQQLIFPDILIFLQAPVEKLQQNIHRRNRPYEQQIPDAYLQDIQASYLSYLQQRSGITLMVDASNANFSEDPRHLERIVDALQKDYTEGIHRLHLP